MLTANLLAPSQVIKQTVDCHSGISFIDEGFEIKAKTIIKWSPEMCVLFSWLLLLLRVIFLICTKLWSKCPPCSSIDWQKYLANSFKMGNRTLKRFRIVPRRIINLLSNKYAHPKGWKGRTGERKKWARQFYLTWKVLFMRPKNCTT